MITEEQVMATLVEISECAGDPESAHASEDALWESVLVAISQGAGNARELARLALKSREIEFERWYA